MNIVFPFHPGDYPRALDWMRWAADLGGCHTHTIFLMPAKSLTHFTELRDTAERTFASVEILRDEEGIEGWPLAPNSLLRQAAWHFYLHQRGPWLFLENDAIPLVPDWLDRLAAEYAACGQPFLGALVKGAIGQGGPVPDHMTGNAIYPQNTVELAPNLLQAMKVAFDVVGAKDTLKQMHPTRLIQHLFNMNGPDTPPTFPDTASLARLSPDAVLFHRVKDGSLIQRLREQRGITSSENLREPAKTSSPRTPLSANTAPSHPSTNTTPSHPSTNNTPSHPSTNNTPSHPNANHAPTDPNAHRTSSHPSAHDAPSHPNAHRAPSPSSANGAPSYQPGATPQETSARSTSAESATHPHNRTLIAATSRIGDPGASPHFLPDTPRLALKAAGPRSRWPAPNSGSNPLTRVFTYFRPCESQPAREEQEWLLRLWRRRWAAHGFKPIVLTEADAGKHPRFATLRAQFAALPTVNPPAYELACWLRWVAMSATGGGLLTDYDVLPCEFTPDDLPPHHDSHPWPLLLCERVPCIVRGTAAQYENALTAFLTCPPGTEQGRPHLSDMHAAQTLGFPSVDLCLEYGRPGWSERRLVHFSHTACHPERRSEVIGDLFPHEDEPADPLTTRHEPAPLTEAACIARLRELCTSPEARARLVEQLQAADLLPSTPAKKHRRRHH